jgi:hypothetical protein
MALSAAVVTALIADAQASGLLRIRVCRCAIAQTIAATSSTDDEWKCEPNAWPDPPREEARLPAEPSRTCRNLAD